MSGAEPADTSTGHRPLTVSRLAAGVGKPVVVVDFLQLSATRQVGEVLGAEHHGQPVYRIDPVTDLAGDGRYRPLDALADDYARACTGMGLARCGLAVAGYCSAAALALLLAARLAERTEVTPVLVQPAWPDARSITADFRGFRTDLGAIDDPGPGTDAGIAVDLAAGPEQVLERMHDVLRGDLRAMAAVRGLDPELPALAELLARYRAWLGFLLSTRDALRRPWPRDTRPRVLVGIAAQPHVPWSDPGTSRVARLPVAEEDLLADASFAGTLLALTRAGDGRAG